MFLVLLVAVSVSVTATLDYYNSLGLRLADNEACRSSLLLHHWLLHAGLHHWLHSWLHHHGLLHTWLHHGLLHTGLHHWLLHARLHHLLLHHGLLHTRLHHWLLHTRLHHWLLHAWLHHSWLHHARLLHHWLLHTWLHHWLHAWLHHWLHTWLHHRLHAGLHHRLLHSWLHHLLLGCLLRLGLTLSGGLEHTLDVDLSRGFTSVGNAEPLIDTTGDAKGGKLDDCDTNNIVGARILVVDLNVHVIANVFHIDLEGLIPNGGLASTVLGCGLVLLLARGYLHVGIHLAEGFRITGEPSLDDSQGQRS